MTRAGRVLNAALAVGAGLWCIGLADIGAARAQSPIDWSGFHLGANAGVTRNASPTSASVPAGGSYFTGTDFAQISSAGDGRLTDWRPTGGVEGGYTWQAGRLLIGLDAGAHALFLDDQRASGAVYLTQPTAQFRLQQTLEADWMATARARLGYAGDRWTVFVAGGPALTRATMELRMTDTYNGGNSGRASDSATKLGWTLGLGGEYAIDPRWSVKLQYLYTDFGRVDSTIKSFGNLGTSDLESSADFRLHAAMLGITYRFGGN